MKREPSCSCGHTFRRADGVLVYCGDHQDVWVGVKACADCGGVPPSPKKKKEKKK